jgi:hypothetical protein
VRSRQVMRDRDGKCSPLATEQNSLWRRAVVSNTTVLSQRAEHEHEHVFFDMWPFFSFFRMFRVKNVQDSEHGYSETMFRILNIYFPEHPV